MNGLSGFFLALVKPAASRVFAALGLGVVTVAGVDSALSGLQNQILSVIGGLPRDTLMLIGLYGGWEALGYVFGGATAAVTYFMITKATRILSSGS